MNSAKIGRRSLLGAAGLLMARPLHAWAAGAKPRVTIQTDHGAIVVELEAEKAPITAANFLRYVDARKYDGGAIYRASRARGTPGGGSIQGGPSVRARRFAPIAHESTRTTGLRHKAGTISMARNAPGSATADFFICASPMAYLDAHPGAPGDNQGFAAFGAVIKGLDVVRKILALPTDGTPLTPGMKGQMLNPPVAILGMTRVR
ncbi:MAG: peptidyl-prolyl cis-trans isomerase cyclophilin type [Caulobacter sp.]|nr:peptidyl-prolyl cis-trans isomerase cyclophilin type [Caulobacter sp.]